MSAKITIMVDMRTPLGLRRALDKREALEAKGYRLDSTVSSHCRWVMRRPLAQNASEHDGEGRHPMQALSWKEFKKRRGGQP